MFATRLTGSFLVLSALCVGAQAQTTTREQVRIEWAQAVRSGDIAPAGEGMTLREMHPQLYGAPAPTLAKTRAETKAELAEAVRTGDVVATGDSGMKLNELHPQTFGVTTFAAAGKSREQVKFELAEAVRTGDIVDGDTGMKLNEMYPQRFAAARAVNRVAQGTVNAASSVSR